MLSITSTNSSCGEAVRRRSLTASIHCKRPTGPSVDGAASAATQSSEEPHCTGELCPTAPRSGWGQLSSSLQGSHRSHTHASLSFPGWEAQPDEQGKQEQWEDEHEFSLSWTTNTSEILLVRRDRRARTHGHRVCGDGGNTADVPSPPLHSFLPSALQSTSTLRRRPTSSSWRCRA